MRDVFVMKQNLFGVRGVHHVSTNRTPITHYLDGFYVLNVRHTRTRRFWTVRCGELRHPIGKERLQIDMMQSEEWQLAPSEKLLPADRFDIAHVSAATSMRPAPISHRSFLRTWQMEQKFSRSAR